MTNSHFVWQANTILIMYVMSVKRNLVPIFPTNLSLVRKMFCSLAWLVKRTSFWAQFRRDFINILDPWVVINAKNKQICCSFKIRWRNIQRLRWCWACSKLEAYSRFLLTLFYKEHSSFLVTFSSFVCNFVIFHPVFLAKEVVVYWCGIAAYCFFNNSNFLTW